MDTDLSAHEEDLLRRITLGEVARDAPDVQRQVSINPAFALACEQLLDLQARLDRQSASDHEALRDILPGSNCSGTHDGIRDDDRRVVADALAAARRAPTARRPRPSRAWLLLPAAALLIAVVLMQRSGQGVSDAPLDGMLSEDRGAHEPVGVVVDFSIFQVDVELEGWDTLEITIYDGSGGMLLESPPLDRSRWELNQQENQVLEDVDTIEWSYRILRPVTGDSFPGGPFRATRSR
jgi:hypothetical protein